VKSGATKGSIAALVIAFCSALLVMVIVMISTGRGAFPLFFDPDGRTTYLRLVVLGAAALAYLASAVMVAGLGGRSGRNFFLFYHLGLALTALGLAAVLFESSFGNLLSWIGRGAQYLGSIFLAVGAVEIAKEGRSRGTRPADFLATLFAGLIDERVRIESDRIRNELEDRASRAAKLSEHDAMLAASVHHSHDAVFLSAPDGRILAANPAACEMFQRSESEIVSLGRAALLDETDVAVTEFLRERERLGFARGILCLRRKDGSTFTGDVSSSIFLAWGGERRTCIFARDISDLVRAQNALEERGRELDAANRRLRDLNDSIFKAREEERRRLAQEINDDLGQRLAASGYYLHSIADSLDESQVELKSTVESLIEGNNETILRLRGLTSSLRLLYDLGLEAALRWLVADFSREKSLSLSLECDFDDLGLGRETGTAAFRIVEESLANVVAHSGAANANVAIRAREDRLYIAVSDDGIGLDERRRAEADSLGLLEIEERVARLNGTFSLSGVSGKGTVVAVELPLSPKEG
jgi:PAS domain S-box-containing protein